MSSPTFDSVRLFDSLKADSTLYSEGVLWAPDYSKITQTIHFNGEDGNTLLDHGWPDRQWLYKGLMSADTLAHLKTRLRAIQTQIDLIDTDANYKTLVDSFGNVYTKAKIQTMHIADIHKSDDGYVATVQITGVIKGMVMDGETS